MRRLDRLFLAIFLAAIPAAAQITFTAPTATLTAGAQTVAYGPVAFTATGGTGPYTYAVTGGALPGGLTLSTGGSLSGTPTASGTFSFTVTATDSTAPTPQTGSQAFSLTINPAPSITTTTLPATTVGAAYSQFLAGTGGTGALTYTVTAGALPTGITLSTAGALSGTVTALANTYNFTATVTDSLGATGTRALSILVNPAPTITTTSPLPTGAQNSLYSTDLVATGGTGTLTFSAPTPAQIPAGLNLSIDGHLTGTPTVNGIFNITFRVVDSLGAFSEKPLSLTILAPASLSNISPTSALAGAADVALTVTGSGFLNGAVVNFGATALSTAFVSSTQLTATIPVALTATPGAVNVTVSNPSAGPTSPATFTVQAPSIGSISPTSVLAGAATFTLTVNGSNFVNGTTYQSAIRWNGSPLSTTFVNSGQLTAQVASNLVASPGTAQITVANTPTAITPATTFTISSAPVINSLSPSSATAGGPTFTLSVTGSGFVNGSTVQWAGSALATTFVNSTLLTATVPSNLIATAGSANITVLNPGDILSPAVSFTINAVPSISSLSPASAIAGAPTFTLTVNGANFVAGAFVQWASTPLTTTFVSSSQLTASVPSNLVAAAGSVNITVVNPGPVTSAPAVFTIGAAPVISSLTPASASAGAPAFVLTVSGTGFVTNSTVQWGGTPLSTTFVSATQLTASVPSTLLLAPASVNITVVNPGPVTSAPAVFTVGAAPTITSITPLTTTAGAPIFTLTVNGSGFNATSVIRLAGQALVTTFLSANQLSALVSPNLIPSSGAIQVAVVNAGPVVSNTTSLVVNPATQFITSPTLTPGLIGVAYSQALNVTGGTPPYQFAFMNGNFPPGLALNTANGALTGTPTTSGSYDFAIQVTDSVGFAVTRVFTLVVAPSLSISTAAALPTGAVGLAYSVQLAATGGLPPYSNWQVTTGSLPPGISLNTATGLLSGTPTATGSYAFLIQVRDSAAQTANKGFTLAVNAGLSITSTSQPPTAIIGTAFQFALTAAGGTQPYAWTVAIGTLPAGLTLNTATGAITGTPTAVGTSAVTIEVRDAAGQTARAPFTFEVLSGLSIVTPTALPTATSRAAYTNFFQASGGTPPYSNWRIVSGAVPAALVLNAATGELSGTPNNPGDYAFTIAVNDSTTRTVSKAFTLTVLPPGLAITTGATLPPATFGAAYNVTLQADGGAPPYRWNLSSGTLPAGLTLAANGLISGTPTAVGSATFNVTVLDSRTRSASRDFTLAVTVPTLPTFTLSGPADTVDPATQPRLALDLATAYPAALSGTVVLTFTADTVNAPPAPTDDPALQFANGSRTIRFTIPAGATAAQFEGTPAFQTGTLAGTIILTTSFSTGSTPVPGVIAPRTIRVLRAAPSIRSATVTRTASGFDVTITAFSTPREVTQAVFRFTPSSGANLQTTELTLPLTAPASAWFTGDASRAYGGQFTYRQSFTLTGEANAIASLSVTLSNSTGASQPITANVP